MFYKMLENYIKNLTKDEVVFWGFKNDIILKPEEADYIYKIIKTDYQKLLGNNYLEVFENAKERINEKSLKKIYNLFLDYREKYKYYFN